ncbi:MAG: S9 family peptidase [Spirosomataceae bacterium]|jgi:dipeptidyl aminopeptidase/acylaminoacyl peptidase
MKKLITLIFLVPWIAFSQSEKIKATDLTLIKTVTSISTVKNKTIYSLQTIEKSDEKPLEYDYVNNIFLLSEDKKSSSALTRGKEGAAQAELSPDGKKVAFVRKVKEKSQIFILPLEGGEPWQLTNMKYGASSPTFSPDGNKILFSTSIKLEDLANDSTLNPNKTLPGFSLEKPGFETDSYILNNKVKPNPDGSLEEIRAYLNKNAEDKKTRVFNRLNFQGEAGLNGEINFNHIYEIDVQENAKPRALVSGFASYNTAQYSADGKSILAITALNIHEHPDREQENKIIQINLSDLSQKTVLEQKNKAFRGFSISPSGKKIVSVIADAGVLSYGQFCIFNSDGSGFKIIKFDRIPGNFVWSKDEKTLFFTAQSNGGTPVFKMDVTSEKITRITDYESAITALNQLETGEWIYAKHEVANPNEIYLASADFSKAYQVSDLNGWVKNKKLSFPEKGTFKNAAKKEIEFWIMKPIDMEVGKKYPLVLQLHGGPTAMWGPGEASMWHEFQYFTAQGYGVVYPNQRGSGGYGKDFMVSNYRDWGKGPQEDALKATEIAAAQSWVDTSRQVITGGSYAGYLTAWIIAHDHRFKAAFAQRGVYDLSTFMGEGNAWRLTPNYFGLPWEDESVTKIRENSPYTYVNKITTPFLIKHGDNDLRTGVIQSEMMYKSLKYLGREVEYVRYQGATHELSRSGNVRQRIDRILRIHEFFQRYIGK